MDGHGLLCIYNACFSANSKFHFAKHRLFFSLFVSRPSSHLYNELPQAIPIRQNKVRNGTYIGQRKFYFCSIGLMTWKKFIIKKLLKVVFLLQKCSLYIPYFLRFYKSGCRLVNIDHGKYRIYSAKIMMQKVKEKYIENICRMSVIYYLIYGHFGRTCMRMRAPHFDV